MVIGAPTPVNRHDVTLPQHTTARFLSQSNPNAMHSQTRLTDLGPEVDKTKASPLITAFVGDERIADRLLLDL